MILFSFPIRKIIIPCSYCASLSHLTACTPTKSNLYLANSLATAVNEPTLHRLLTFHAPNLMPIFRCLRRSKYNPGPRQVFMLLNKNSFYCEDLSTTRPNPKLEDHPLSADGYCLFSILAATLHTGGRSSIRNMRTRHAVVTRTQCHGKE